MSGITLMMLGNFALASGATPSSLYVWGGNYNGSSARNLNDTAGESSSPIQLGSETDWLQFSGAYNFVGTRSSGHLYSCGDGRFGCWNTGLSASSPIQIGSLTNWTGGVLNQEGVACHVIKKDGSLWGWGENDYGAVGVNTGSGDISKYSSPVQIGSLTTWAWTTGGGYAAVQAVKTDGTLWTWGIASQGGLGNSTDTPNKSSPVQIGSLTNWLKGASGGENHQIHVKTDGTLWTWGNNNYGQLGNGGTGNTNSPNQVGSSTGWTACGAGYQTSGAIDAGKLYMAGRNNNGELGRNVTTTTQTTFQQVGALTTWEDIRPGNGITLAKKTDGTIWAWGANWIGQAGQSTKNPVKYSSPVQIGSQTDWTAIHLGTTGSATAMGGRA
tara:strand:+ start:1 stop:1152 length:1152 start_codon:yes stop_codon:yes gene_type:complete